MSPEQRLRWYVDVWEVAVADVLALLRGLDPADWQRPTDLPGWDVRAVAAHLSHIESVLAGVPQPAVDVPLGPRATTVPRAYTEAGPAARAAWSAHAIVEELATSAAGRVARLRSDPPTDPAGRPEPTPGGIAWDWQTLLSNRVVDLWMHEQDIRRAVGRPGGLDGPAAAHTLGVFTGGLGYVVGKRVAPPAGTTVALEVTGPQPVRAAVEVGPEGRAVRLPDPPAHPTVRLVTDVEGYVVLCGGRRPPEAVAVEVDGDPDLGRRVLAALAVTP